MIETNSEELNTPIAAYVIFETQENKERCLNQFEAIKSKFRNTFKYIAVEPLKILNQKIPVEETGEPSNVLWENQGNSQIIIF